MDTQLILVQEEPRGPSQLIQIVVDGVKNSIPLPQVQELMSVDNITIIVKAIRLISPKVLAMAPNGNANAPLTELVKISLRLWSEGWIKGQLIPILTLNDVADGDSAVATTIPYRNKAPRFDNWKKIDWNKSTLEFSQGTVPVPTYTVVLEVEYLRLDANGNLIQGPN